MKDFEFIFALYSLLLGLSMVELLGGLGRALEMRLTGSGSDEQPDANADDADARAFTIGWLTPLLALFVMLDLLSFWAAAWAARSSISVSGHSLLAVVSFASLYFLAARMVFPSQPEKFANLDAHYFKVRRMIFGLLLVLLGAQWAFYWSIPALAQRIAEPTAMALTAVLILLMLAAMWTRKTVPSIIILLLLIARYVSVYMAF